MKRCEWTKEQKQEWEKWLSERPPQIRELAQKFPPDKLYLLKTSNHRVYPISYSEDGTLTVVVSGQYNVVMFDRNVFGINPNDLEECDLPDENESLGTVLTEEEDVESYIDTVRPIVLEASAKNTRIE